MFSPVSVIGPIRNAYHGKCQKLILVEVWGCVVCDKINEVTDIHSNLAVL